MFAFVVFYLIFGYLTFLMTLKMELDDTYNFFSIPHIYGLIIVLWPFAIIILGSYKFYSENKLMNDFKDDDI